MESPSCRDKVNSGRQERDGSRCLDRAEAGARGQGPHGQGPCGQEGVEGAMENILHEDHACQAREAERHLQHRVPLKSSEEGPGVGVSALGRPRWQTVGRGGTTQEAGWDAGW